MNDMDKQRMERLAKVAISESRIPRKYWATFPLPNRDNVWSVQLQTEAGALAEEVNVELYELKTDEAIISELRKRLASAVSERR